MGFRYNPFTGKLDRISSEGLWDSLSDSVNASSTKAIDTIANTSFKSLKYIIAIFNEANNAYNTFELTVLNENGSYRESLSNKIKTSGFNLRVNTVNNAGNFELQIENNESFPATIELAKLVLS